MTTQSSGFMACQAPRKRKGPRDAQALDVRRVGRSTGQTANELPQPHPPEAFGFSKVNPDAVIEE